MATPKPTGKTAIAVIGDRGDYCFLQNYKLLFKGHEEANVHFSVESMKTEHGLTVNYAKYEYIEENNALSGVHYGTHFIFIEFATSDDAMKALWDGFPLAFASIIFATLRVEDPEEKVEGPYFGEFEDILKGLSPGGYWKHAAWIVNKDLPIARALEKGGNFYEHIASQFQSGRFHLIKMPAVETWEQAEDVFRSEWYPDLHDYREMIEFVSPDTSLEVKPHWKFQETGRGTNFRAEIYVLPEDDGGVPIAAGDRLTFTDGPNDVEGTLGASNEMGRRISPRIVWKMMVDVDKPLQYLDLNSRFAMKKDGKFVALGILGCWGR